MLEFKKIIKRKDSRIMIALSLWPLMLSTLTMAFPDVFVIETNGLIGAYDFLAEMIILQDLVFLPVLIIVYSASLTFYSEIHNKQIYMYKDVKRKEILNSKYLATYGLYLIYFIFYIILALLSYYLVFNNLEVASGTFFTEKKDILPQLYEVVQVVLGILFYINIGIFFAIRYASGISIFSVTLLYMFLKIVPSIEKISYLFPTGYRDMKISGSGDFWKYILLSFLVSAIYNFIIYIVNRSKFNNMEFN